MPPPPGYPDLAKMRNDREAPEPAPGPLSHLWNGRPLPSPEFNCQVRQPPEAGPKRNIA